MADPVASVERIVKVGLKIKEAADTVRRNEVVCQEIRKRARAQSPATGGALDDLEETLQRALRLVTAAGQERSAIRRLFAAGDLSRQLREVKEDILNKVMLASFAINARTTVLLLTMHTGGYLLPRLHQDTGVVEISQNSHSTDNASIKREPFSLDNGNDRSELGDEQSNVLLGSEPTASIVANLRKFMSSEVWAATNEYSDRNIIGRGGSCTVYKGVLENGNTVAIKIFREPYLGWTHTYDRLVLASKLQHKNVAKVLGYADGRIGIKEQEYIWVEEYMPKGTLRNFIYGKAPQNYWSSLKRAIKGIAQGVCYLHEQHVVHLDLKPDNILFDSYMNPVITDFELSKVLDDTEITSEHNKIAGTFPYIAPEHTADGIISTKSDVYAFGITLLEAISSIRRRSEFPLHRWGWTAWEAGLIEAEFNPAAFTESQLKKIKRYVEVGLVCAQQDRADRPTMADVLEMLKGKKKLPIPKKPTYTEPYEKWIPAGRTCARAIQVVPSSTSVRPGSYCITDTEHSNLRRSWRDSRMRRVEKMSVGSLSPSVWSQESLSPR
ncbi:unnamed protein product [Urochloa decumbens]|uniref:Protein kinase domain-containing protein n=1 Tax=Urochloa decumbens TaxID=240449 RepID=A0ABC9ASK3_9POAL